MKRRHFLKSLVGLPAVCGLYLALEEPKAPAFSHPLLDTAKQLMSARQQRGLVFCLPQGAHERRALGCELYALACDEPYLGLGGLADHRHFIAEYRAAMILAANTVMICLEEKVVTACWGPSSPYLIIDSSAQVSGSLAELQSPSEGRLASQLQTLVFGDNGELLDRQVDQLKLRCDPAEVALADAAPELWIREQLNTTSANQPTGTTQVELHRDRLARTWLSALAIHEDTASMSWVDEELLKLSRLSPTLPLGTRFDPVSIDFEFPEYGPFTGRPYLDFHDPA